MATHAQAALSAPKELFRYARLRPPDILDLRRRAAAEPELKPLLDAPPLQQQAWARGFLATGHAVHHWQQLRSAGLKALDERLLDAARRPALPRPARGEAESPPDGEALAADLRDCLCTLLAHRWQGQPAETQRAARRLQLVESWRRPSRGDRGGPWALPVWQRFAPPAIAAAADPPGPAEHAAPGDAPAADDTAAELRLLREGIAALWRARVAAIAARRTAMVELHRAALARDEPAAPAAAEQRPATAQQLAQARLQRLRQRKAELAEARLRFRSDYLDHVDLADALARPAGQLAPRVSDEGELALTQRMVARLMRRHALKPTDFCRSYEAVVQRLDTMAVDPAAPTPPAGCFAVNPQLTMQASVRLLGVAELIKVEETFLGYSEGEISYVENVLAGELRRRKVRDSRSVEQLEESTTEDSSALDKESAITTTSELSSQVETELQTRFNTDVNASGSASGGGSFGVVDLQGSGSVSAGLGLDVDSSLGTRNESNFGQEIVDKAVEKTRKSVVTRRLQRTTTLHETMNLHEIDNTAGNPPQHRRGVYCFLDKRVCISQTLYGRRLFLMAQLPRPGHDLVCAQRLRIAADLHTLGDKPQFDITPADVQPSNYLALVGRYRAQNVQPPPPAVQRLARTYKTDAMNANAAGAGFDMKKIAESLVPFFAQYQRYLVTDTLTLPEGYELQDVWVTVNHGANGISVPAHLPLSVAGAAIYSTPLLAASAVYPFYLPLALWQVAVLASPLLHFNADSSSVTVCVGNEAQDSLYYFFKPDELVAAIFDLLGNLGTLGPGLVQTLREAADALFAALAVNAAAVPPQMASAVSALVNAALGKVNAVFAKVLAALNLADGGDPAQELIDIGQAMEELVKTVTLDVAALQSAMNEFFAPVQAFFDQVFAAIQQAFEASLSDFFSLLMEQSENSQTLSFTQAWGSQKELPVSINAVAIKPGITLNLVACLRRSEHALEQWRLDTFNRLYQAHLQRVAEYESRYFGLADKAGLARSPGTLRQEEHLALKEQVLHALNNLHGAPGNQYALARINLFEHAVDWKNMSHRLYTYGPSAAQLTLERSGVFRGADARRLAFLTAHWAQVMLPLQPDERLEQALLSYLESGQADLEAGLHNDELAALYQALVQERALADEQPLVLERRPQLLPTDLVVLKLDDTLPASGADCTPP